MTAHATLEDVEGAIWQALATLVPGYVPDGATTTTAAIVATAGLTTHQPVRALRRYAGEVSRATLDAIEKGLGPVALTDLPAVFWAFEGARPVGPDGAWVEAVEGQSEVRVRSLWRAFVVVSDLRGDAQAMLSNVALQPAALSISHRIVARLAGLAIPNTQARNLLWIETIPWLVGRRLYVAAVRFAAESPLDQDSAAADPTETAFEGADGVVQPAQPGQPVDPSYFNPFEANP